MSLFRDIIKKTLGTLRETLAGQQDVQLLFDRKHIKMEQTRIIDADDHAGVKSWTYRFKFDNPSRKRRFLQTIEEFPPQDWDQYVRWFDDISNMDGEICIEAQCKVPPEETARFQQRFKDFITREMVVKG